MKKNFLLALFIFILFYLFQSFDFGFNKKYLGDKVRLIYSSSTSPARVEVREVYLRERNYDLLASPTLIGYYISFIQATDLPVESVKFIRTGGRFSAVNAVFETPDSFKVLFDNQISVKYFGGCWSVNESTSQTRQASKP
jgi:hypothetical protein